MALSFKYRREILRGEERHFPKIPVVLHGRGARIESAALLDSGATDIFIPREIADILGLELKNEDYAEGWNGSFKVWESRIGIVVGKGSQTFRQELPCVVPEERGENQDVIFGRSFFAFFEITFSESKKTTILKRMTYER